LRGSRARGIGGLAVFTTAVALLIVGTGCGSGNNAATHESVEAPHSREAQRRRVQRQAAIRRAHARARHEIAQRRARRAEHEREREQQARERRARVAEEEEAQAAAEEEPEPSCDSNYSGACLDPAASDYDCEGGSGNGPYYTGTVTVVGEDHYELDADSDGTGCESE
jgi:hypothetical protein